MSEIGRFGVFLPSYIWAGDGPERARGIRTFARAVEDLGFDSLFITDHLLAAKRFYSVSFLEPLAALAVAAGVTERVRLGTSILIMPLRNPVLLAKELATLQFLSENRVILGAGVGWNDAEYEAVGVHKSERGKRTDEMLDIITPLLEGQTVTYHGRYYSVDDVFIEPTASQRPEIWIGGGSQLADPKSPDLPRFVESVKARVLRTDGWIPRPTCPPEDIARDWVELQAYYREHGRDPDECVVAHENFLHLVLTDDPGQGPRGAASSVPEGHERRARPEVPGVGLPVRYARRGHRLPPGAGRRRRRVLRPAHHDARPRPAPGVGRRDHPPRDVPRHGRTGAADGARPAVTQRVALLGKPLRRRHSQVMHDAAFAAAGIDARYELLELDEADVPAAVAQARGPDWLGLQVTAPYKRLVAGLCDRVEADAATIGAVNSVARTSAGELVGFNTDAPGFRAAVELAMGRPLAGRRVVVAGAGGAAHAVVFTCLSAGADRVTIGNRTVASAAALAERFGGVGAGSVAAVALDDPAFTDALRSADLAVNATTVGMLEPGTTIDVEALRGDATVFDLVYVPPETPLLRAARARGLRAANGSEMLIQQAAIAFERWTGVGGMADVMRAAVAPLLADVAAGA